MIAGNRDAKTGMRQQIESRLADMRVEVVVERIHPQDDPGIVVRSGSRVSDGGRAPSKCRLTEGERRETRHLALVREMQDAPQQILQTWRMAQRVGDPRSH